MNSQYGDPNLRAVILNKILNNLLSASFEKSKRELEQLIERNSALIGNDLKSIRIQGKPFQLTIKVQRHRRRGQASPVNIRNTLHPELEEVGNAWFSRRNQLEADARSLKNILSCVLNISNVFTDICELLPESLHGYVQELREYFPPEGVSLGEDRIMAFKQAHSKSLDQIKHRMAINLLTT